MKTKTKKERHNAIMARYQKKTQGLARSRKRWTNEEEVLILSSPLNAHDLALIIQRSQQSINDRKYKLRKESKFIIYDTTAYAAVSKEYGSTLNFIVNK